MEADTIVLVEGSTASADMRGAQKATGVYSRGHVFKEDRQEPGTLIRSASDGSASKGMQGKTVATLTADEPLTNP